MLHQLAIEWIIILTNPSKVVAGLSRQAREGPKIPVHLILECCFFLRLCHPSQLISFDFFSKQGMTNRTWSYKLLVFMGCQSKHNSKLLWKLGVLVNCPPTSAPILNGLWLDAQIFSLVPVPVLTSVGQGVRNEVRTGQEPSPVLTRKTVEYHLPWYLSSLSDSQDLIGVRIDPWYPAFLFQFF